MEKTRLRDTGSSPGPISHNSGNSLLSSELSFLKRKMKALDQKFPAEARFLDIHLQ